MPIHFRCEKCNAELWARDGQGGKVAVCRDCGASMEIPMVGIPEEVFPIPPLIKDKKRPKFKIVQRKEGCFGCASMIVAAVTAFAGMAAALAAAIFFR